MVPSSSFVRALSRQLGFAFPPDPQFSAALPFVPPPSVPASLSLPSASLPSVPLPSVPLQPCAPIEPTVRGQANLERLLRDHLGPRVIVVLTSNRSTMISYARKRQVLYVRLHAMFAEAPPDVLHAVAQFVSEARPKERDTRLIDEWIHRHRPHLREANERAPAVSLQPHGEVHDLQAMLDRINGHYFEAGIAAQITWSRAARNRRRRSIRMGSYCDELKLIRIHPALDQSFVPAPFVESVVFHEMLHEAHGIEERGDGKRCIHTPKFLEDELRFEGYEEARRWEAKNLHRLLRY